MNHGFGIEPPSAHHHSPLQQPVRYVVVIDSGGSMIARLFLASRELVGKFGAHQRHQFVVERSCSG